MHISKNAYIENQTDFNGKRIENNLVTITERDRLLRVKLQYTIVIQIISTCSTVGLCGLGRCNTPPPTSYYFTGLVILCSVDAVRADSRARGYKTFFMLNSIEHEIFPAHRC